MNIEEIKDRVDKTKNVFHKLGIEGQVNINLMLNDIDFLLTAYEKEKEKNKVYSDVICRVRNLSSGVVSYDIINGKKYLGPRKNFSKQRLYEQFLNIELILKGNYIFLSNEEYLQQLIEEE